MIKIFHTEQIRQADAYTIKHAPVSSIHLMERAAKAFTEQLLQDYPDKCIPKCIVCGNGNNGGDGLAIARMLLSKGHKANIYILPAKRYSNDFSKNLQRLSVKHKKHIHTVQSADFIDSIPEHAILVDAILGTGLNAPLQKDTIQYQVIAKLNQRTSLKVISVDTPSGLFCDAHTNGIAVKASKTYTFQFPKPAFLLPENGNYVNDFTILDIGLHPDYIASTPTSLYYLTRDDISQRIHSRKKYSHKGIFGHAAIAAGSFGKMGAAVLAGKSALRAGCGLVTLHIPACGYSIMQTSFPEAMCTTDKHDQQLSTFPTDEKYDAIAIGPGIGTHSSTTKALELFLKAYQQPVVLDADALNILSKKKNLLKSLPKRSILTPHPKEFERLAGKWQNDFERLALQQTFSKKYQVIVILKGAHTSISDTNGDVYFNSTGNPGMASGGSGDVLTGILAGLLAQRYTPEESAMIAVYLHGLAGDKALQQQSMESLIASDIIDNIGNAFNEIRS